MNEKQGATWSSAAGRKRCQQTQNKESDGTLSRAWRHSSIEPEPAMLLTETTLFICQSQKTLTEFDRLGVLDLMGHWWSSLVLLIKEQKITYFRCISWPFLAQMWLKTNHAHSYLVPHVPCLRFSTDVVRSLCYFDLIVGKCVKVDFVQNCFTAA